MTYNKIITKIFFNIANRMTLLFLVWSYKNKYNSYDFQTTGSLSFLWTTFIIDMIHNNMHIVMSCSAYYFNETYRHEKEVNIIKNNILFFYKRILKKLFIIQISNT